MTDAPDSAAKTDLKRYLVSGREALIWKLDGLSEFDARRPLVPTGTNLLGLVKHMAGVEAGYLGLVFGRPFPEPLPWTADDVEFNTDMWATPDQSRESLIALYRRVGEHSSATIDALTLDTIGRVPWWTGDRSAASLHEILVHLVAETQRHAGHADLVRELIDGEVGLRQGNDNLPPADRAWWEDYRERVESAARAAAAR